MTDYIIRATNAPGWRKHKDGILAISVGKEYHEGDKFLSTMNWAAKHFDRIHVVVADTLQRYNFASPNAGAQSLAAGSLWIARYIQEIENTGKFCSLVRWDDLLKDSDFPGTLEAFRHATTKNKMFREAMHTDINRFISRQRDLHPESWERSKNYLIEELAAFTLHAQKQPGARIYPSKNLECFRLVEAGLVPEAPKGMEKQQRIALNFEKRTSVEYKKTGSSFYQEATAAQA